MYVYLAGGAIASALVGALCVQMVSPRLIGVVTPGDLEGARAIRAIASLEEIFSTLLTGVANQLSKRKEGRTNCIFNLCHYVYVMIVIGGSYTTTKQR